MVDYSGPDCTISQKDDVLDLSSKVELDGFYVNARSPVSFIVCGKVAHLSMYLNKVRDMPNVPVATVPPEYAPARTFLCPISVVKGICYPLSINDKGQIWSNVVTERKGEVLIADVTWITR